MARRLLQKHNLTPPIDVHALIQQYADVTFRYIPLPNVDGVSLDLKAAGKRPRVIVNSSKPRRRQTFTLAHELGHITIPWHVGTIPDIVGFSSEDLQELPVMQSASSLTELGRYSQLEAEADRFASELLMPEQWVKTQIAQQSNLARLHQTISEGAGVSPLAAAIRLRDMLPPGIVYFCVESDVDVSFAGRTAGTLQRQPSRGRLEFPVSYAYALTTSTWETEYSTYYWFSFPTEITLAESDPRPWKEILHTIVIAVQPDNAESVKHVVNAVIANAHSLVLRNGLLPYTEDAIIAACIHQLGARADLKEIAVHPDMMQVIKKRAAEWYAKRHKR